MVISKKKIIFIIKTFTLMKLKATLQLQLMIRLVLAEKI